MYCNKIIHNELINMGELNCPFCDQELARSDIKPSDVCCDRQEIINDRGESVCKHCGQVSAYDYVTEYVDFYENMWKIRRKSVYHRKYHIENVIYKANIRIPRVKMEKIYRVFDEIEKIAASIDNKRKRIISINFIIRQLLMLYMPRVPYEDIKITKSKKTLKYYDEYWKSIIDLIGDKIKKIFSSA